VLLVALLACFAAPAGATFCGAGATTGALNCTEADAECLDEALWVEDLTACACRIGYGALLNSSDCAQITSCTLCADRALGKPDVGNDQCFPAVMDRDNGVTNGQYVTGQDGCGQYTFTDCAEGTSTRGGSFDLGVTSSSDCFCGIDRYYDDSLGSCSRCNATRGKDSIANGISTSLAQDSSGRGSVDMISSCPCAPGYTPEYAVDVDGNTYDTEVCLPCAADTYKDTASDVDACTACPESAGDSKPGAADVSECICEYGDYTIAYDDEGAVSFSGCACPEGFFIQFGTTTTCEPCPLGYYKTDKGNFGCTLCPQGYGSQTTTNASSTPDSCACLAPFAKNGEGKCACAPSEGYFNQDSFPYGLSAGYQMRECAFCTAGYPFDATGDIATDVSYFCLDGVCSDPCVACPAPTVLTLAKPLANFTDCVCRSGYTIDAEIELCVCTAGRGIELLAGETQCALCSQGYYSELIGNVACTSCQSWATTTGIGSSLSSECFCLPGTAFETATNGSCACEAGSYLTTGSTFRTGAIAAAEPCSPCLGGTYKSTVGLQQGGCTSCPLRADASVFGMTSLEQCECRSDMELSADADSCDCSPGYTLLGSTLGLGVSMSYCEPCVGGMYKSEVGNGGCTACPTDSATAVTKLTDISQCTCSDNRVLSGSQCLCIAGYSNNAGVCDSCPTTSYKEDVGNAACTACPVGMSTAAVGATTLDECECVSTQYTEVQADGTRKCVACPVGAVCNGRVGAERMGTQAGYWRYSRRSISFYACESAVECPGAGTGSETLCRDGHEGPRCVACSRGYGLEAKLCSKCPSLNPKLQSEADAVTFRNNALIIIGALSLVLLAVGVVSYLNIREGALGLFEQGRQNDFTPYAKIILSYLQLTAFAASFPLQWSQTMLDIFEGMRRISEPPLQLRAVDCQFQADNGTEVFSKFLLYMALPPILIGIFVAFWLVIFGWRMAWRRAAYMERLGYTTTAQVGVRMRSNLVITTMVFCFFAHLPLTREVVKLITCDTYLDYDGITHQHLQISPKVMCDQEPHNTWFYTAVFFFCFYSIGIPLTGFLILFKNRMDFGRPAFVGTYGFLFKGFEQRVPHIYWEVTFVMGRKIILVFLQVYLATTTPLIQTLVAVLFIFLVLVIHIWFQPYINETLDRIETLSLTTTFITLYGGLFYYIDFTDSRISGMKEPITIALVFWHVGVVVTMVLVGVHLVLRQAARDGRKFIRRACKGVTKTFSRWPLTIVQPLLLTFLADDQLPAEGKAPIRQKSFKGVW